MIDQSPERERRVWLNPSLTLRALISRSNLSHFRQRQIAQAEGGTDAGLRLQEHPDAASVDDIEPVAEVAALYHRALALIQSEFPAWYSQAFDLLVIQERKAGEVAQQLSRFTSFVKEMATILSASAIVG